MSGKPWCLNPSFPDRSSWKTDRSKQQLKDLNHEEDSLPLIEDVLGNPDQTSSEMPGLEEPDKEAVSGETCEADKKVEESGSDTRPLCTPEERRHVQRERLNQILLNLLEKIPGKNGEVPCHGCTVSFLLHVWFQSAESPLIEQRGLSDGVSSGRYLPFVFSAAVFAFATANPREMSYG